MVDKSLFFLNIPPGNLPCKYLSRAVDVPIGGQKVLEKPVGKRGCKQESLSLGPHLGDFCWVFNPHVNKKRPQLIRNLLN